MPSKYKNVLSVAFIQVLNLLDETCKRFDLGLLDFRMTILSCVSHILLILSSQSRGERLIVIV